MWLFLLTNRRPRPVPHLRERARVVHRLVAHAGFHRSASHNYFERKEKVASAAQTVKAKLEAASEALKDAVEDLKH